MPHLRYSETRPRFNPKTTRGRDSGKLQARNSVSSSFPTTRTDRTLFSFQRAGEAFQGLSRAR